MKKLILLATMFATVLSVSAQRNMQVWEDGSYSEFPTTNVDSVTFLLSTNGTPRTYVTPQFKIESDYWYVSYDEGWTWTQLGKATGEQGTQGPQGEKGEKGDTGAQGPKGDKGDSMFLSVTQDDNYIYLLMTDSTKIQIAKANKSSNDFDKTVIDNLVNSLTISKNTILLRTIGQKDTIVSTTAPFSDSKVVWTSSDESIVSVVDGKIEALQEGYVTITACAATLSQQCKVYVVLERDRGFSVSDTSQVLFSPGNLQYNTAQKIWRFAEHPYEIQGMYNTIRTTLVDNWIDLFSLGCNGYKYDPCESGRVYYQPRSDLGNMDIEIQELSKTDYDFGWYNKISNGGNQTHLWRMFIYDEMEYLLTKRTNANKLVLYSTYNEVSGILILPDGFEKPTIMNSLSVIDDTTWQILSAYGAVFLPQAGSYQFWNNSFGTGSYSFTGVSCSSTYGTNYWCSSFKNYSCPSFLHFDEEHIKMAYPDKGYRLIYNHYPNYGFAVRLVKDL